MLLCLRLHPGPPPDNRSPPPEAGDDPPGLVGPLGRIGGWCQAEDGAGFFALSLWRRENSDAPDDPQHARWHCLQDVGGIYDALPTALLSANSLSLIEREVDADDRVPVIKAQRRDVNPLLARQPGFLAGAFAGSPPSPDRFLELGLWQDFDSARQFLGGLEAFDAPLRIASASLQRTRALCLPILRRYTRERPDGD